MSAELRRVACVLVAYPRRGPWTCAFLAVLLASHVWFDHAAAADAVVAAVSTNLDNLAAHPVIALVGSAFVTGGSLLDPATVITLWLGIGAGLWWIEAHRGALRAGGVFVVGHVGATLLTAAVIVAALHAGRYPDDVRDATDVGISYGSQAALGAAVVMLPAWAWAPGAVFVLGWPLLDAGWYGLLPDFTTVGHLLSAVIGFAAGAWLRRRQVRTGPPTS